VSITTLFTCSPVHLFTCSPVHLFTCSLGSLVHLFTCSPGLYYLCHCCCCYPRALQANTTITPRQRGKILMRSLETLSRHVEKIKQKSISCESSQLTTSVNSLHHRRVKVVVRHVLAGMPSVQRLAFPFAAVAWNRRRRRERGSVWWWETTKDMPVCAAVRRV
jgi:hypothetical protein